ncbi:MAG: hypothetical protein JSV88_00765 [Candidatus Aminicenantes bacterium]|nr:MAG: hypothetical protein JSV88_00765 [Candidatus Aminicenantes bacterium]
MKAHVLQGNGPYLEWTNSSLNQVFQSINGKEGQLSQCIRSQVKKIGGNQ